MHQTFVFVNLGVKECAGDGERLYFQRTYKQNLTCLHYLWVALQG